MEHAAPIGCWCDEQRDPELGAFVYRGFDEAHASARAAEWAVMDGAELRPLHGVPTAMKDPFDFKPDWPSTFGGARALADTVIDASCVFERIQPWETSYEPCRRRATARPD